MTCWGNNGQGQLGIGSTASVGTTASTMGSNMQTVDIGPGTAEASFCASAFNYFYGILFRTSKIFNFEGLLEHKRNAVSVPLY